MSDQKSISEQIAEQNDRFRFGSLSIPGKRVFTSGVNSLKDCDKNEVYRAVRNFDEFTEDNDPYGEHDFGTLYLLGIGTIQWKIDYYDTNYEYGSNEPANLEVTCRVLTIMFAHEY